MAQKVVCDTCGASYDDPESLRITKRWIADGYAPCPNFRCRGQLQIKEQEDREIWHCSCELDRQLAEILVNAMPDEAFNQIAKHLQKPPITNEADKYDLLYQLWGCRKI